MPGQGKHAGETLAHFPCLFLAPSSLICYIPVIRKHLQHPKIYESFLCNLPQKFESDNSCKPVTALDFSVLCDLLCLLVYCLIEYIATKFPFRHSKCIIHPAFKGILHCCSAFTCVFTGLSSTIFIGLHFTRVLDWLHSPLYLLGCVLA